jgi:hypothetical protein
MLAVVQRAERERSPDLATSSRQTRREERIALDEARRIGSMPRRSVAISSALACSPRDCGRERSPRSGVATID